MDYIKEIGVPDSLEELEVFIDNLISGAQEKNLVILAFAAGARYFELCSAGQKDSKGLSN